MEMIHKRFEGNTHKMKNHNTTKKILKKIKDQQWKGLR